MQKNWNQKLKDTELKSHVLFKKANNIHDLLVIKNKIIGRKAQLTIEFKELSIEEKKIINPIWKEFQAKILANYSKYWKELTNRKESNLHTTDLYNQFHEKIVLENNQILTKISNEANDLKLKINKPHPWNRIVNLIHEFANKMQWNFVNSNDITTVQENFINLNISENHPSANWKDCFYLNKKQLLRSHTTNMTSKVLTEYQEDEGNKFYYTIGNVYRNDTEDSTHLWQFSQFDACLIAPKQSIATLKKILQKFSQFIFGDNLKTRFRNSYFPFTEPSIEMDLECLFCKKNNQKKCSVCKDTGWIELLGGGIINPEVLKNCNLNEEMTVLAFGIGIERVAMLKYRINDIRNLYRNTLIIEE